MSKHVSSSICYAAPGTQFNVAAARAKKAAAKRPYHHGDLRRGLLDAALEIVAEGGLPALSLREAARRAGVSPAAPYHHFADRDELVAELVIEGFNGMRAAMEHELASVDDDAVERLCAAGRGYVAYALANPASFQLMFGAGRVCNVERFPAIAQASTPVSEFLMDGVAGVLPIGAVESIDAPRLALLAWAIVHGASSLVLDDALRPGMLSGDATLEARRSVDTFGMILRALTASAPRQPARKP